MKKIAGICWAILCSACGLFAAAGDTAVFRTRLLPENEVPSLSLPGTSAVGQVTVRVVRDGKGAITAATVVFDANFTFAQDTTVIGWHIHNGAAGANGPVVIDSGLRPATPLTGTTGHATRTVNYTSSDTTALGFVTGLLSTPELYYMNMHSTVTPAGFVRGQLQATTVTFRPQLSPANETPPITGLDAQAAAQITVRVNRDDSGTIVSGNVTFDMDYRFAGSVTITGMHIHSGAAGVAGPIVISSGTKSQIANSRGRGTLFRIAEVPSTDATGLAALAGIMKDPTGYYVNLHTTTNPAGAMRGQLDRDTFNFFSHLDGTQEVPVNPSTAAADVMTSIHVNRNGAGNITGADVAFSVSCKFEGQTTLVGMHIHNAPVAVSGPVLINSGLDGSANSVNTDATGAASFTRQVSIDSGNAAALGALYGTIETPELYYLNIHTTVLPAGAIRAQMARETYHFTPTMSSANELPPTTPNASATSWLTIVVNRNAGGTITSGTTVFDVDYNLGGPATITAMHIHQGLATQNGPVVIDSTVTSTASTGTGNLTLFANVVANNTAGVGALVGLIANPAGYYLNLHTDGFPAGLMRSQLLPFVTFNPQVAGGGDWLTLVTITNPSNTASARGLLKVFDQNGNPQRPEIMNPTIPFDVPPASTIALSSVNSGNLSGGFARVHSSSPITSGTAFNFDALTSVTSGPAAVGASVSIPIAVGSGGAQNTGIAILDLDEPPPPATLILLDSAGAQVGSGSIPFPASKQLVGFVNQFLPSMPAQFTGTLLIQLKVGALVNGRMSVLALQFDTGKVTPVTVTVVQ